jgi:hypothetical protein
MHGYPENTSEGGIGIATKREAQGLPDRIRRGNQMPAVRVPESTVNTATTPISAKDFSGRHFTRESADKNSRNAGSI